VNTVSKWLLKHCLEVVNKWLDIISKIETLINKRKESKASSFLIQTQLISESLFHSISLNFSTTNHLRLQWLAKNLFQRTIRLYVMLIWTIKLQINLPSQHSQISYNQDQLKNNLSLTEPWMIESQLERWLHRQHKISSNLITKLLLEKLIKKPGVSVKLKSKMKWRT